MGKSWGIYGDTLWLCQQFAIEHGPVESSWIYPAIEWWIFPVRYRTVDQRVWLEQAICWIQSV